MKIKHSRSVQSHHQIKREIALITATSIVIANMIGSGIFTTSGWVLLCWIFGGFIALAGALCYAELATRMPEEGGEYVYLKKLYHPILGFLTGWTSFFVGFSAPIAASAIGFSEYLFAGLKIHWPITALTQPIFVKKIIAIGIIISLTVVHYLGIRFGSKVQNSLTALKILIVLGLASAGLALGGELPTPNFSFSTSSFQGMAFGTAMMLVMFSYSGWNASAYIGGEIKNPRKTIPISLIAGTTIVMLLYLAINLFIFSSAPYQVLQGKITVVETAAVHVFGKGFTQLLSLLISLALLSSLSAFIILGPRVYFAMAHDRLFFHFAAEVHWCTRKSHCNSRLHRHSYGDFGYF